MARTAFSEPLLRLDRNPMPDHPGSGNLRPLNGGLAIQDTARRKLAYQDYLLFPEDGNRHEILDGEHYVTAAPYPKHQRVLRELLFGLHAFLRQHRLGEVYSAPLDVVLSPHDVVQPDLLFISNERMPILTEKNLQGAPDLAIEILSATTRKLDEGIKLERYERFGVREYWLVDPSRKAVCIYRQSGDRLRKEADLTAAAGDCLTSPLLPGLELPLVEVFQ